MTMIWLELVFLDMITFLGGFVVVGFLLRKIVDAMYGDESYDGLYQLKFAPRTYRDYEDDDYDYDYDDEDDDDYEDDKTDD